MFHVFHPLTVLLSLFLSPLQDLMIGNATPFLVRFGSPEAKEEDEEKS